MTDSELFSYLKHKKDYKETGLNFDYSVEVDSLNKEINVFFKESDSDLDWRINLNFLPTWIKFNKVYIAHRGFVYAYLSAEKELIDDITAAIASHFGYDVCIYGWSYGSAVAGLCLVELYELFGKRIKKMVTFGSVKLWYWPFKKSHFQDMAEEVREYTTPNDFVTWQVPICHRINKKECGDKFSIFKIFKTAYYHCNYQDFIKD